MNAFRLSISPAIRLGISSHNCWRYGVRSFSNATTTTTRIGVDDPRMSRIVIHNKIVYISGQTDTSADDIEGQTLNTLKKVEDLLSEAGTSKSELITASIWLKNIEKDFHSMNAIWSGWVDPENKPVRATVEANMARPQILVEIQVTAALRNASD